MANLAQLGLLIPIFEGARAISKVSKPVQVQVGNGMPENTQKPVFTPLGGPKNGHFRALEGQFGQPGGPTTHSWGCPADLGPFQLKPGGFRSETGRNVQKNRFSPIFGHFAKVSNPYRPFFHFTSIGFMGVVGKVMDSAIIPEKMSSWSGFLGGFMDWWVKLVRFMK